MSSLSDQIRVALLPFVQELTQSELARRSGVAQPTISLWLSGRRTLSPEALAAITAACGVELVVSARRVKANRAELAGAGRGVGSKSD